MAFEQSLELVDEYKTTELATKLYWQEHNPKWWQRILPTSMLIPPQPVDDYVALILATAAMQGLEQYFNDRIIHSEINEGILKA